MMHQIPMYLRTLRDQKLYSMHVKYLLVTLIFLGACKTSQQPAGKDLFELFDDGRNGEGFFSEKEGVFAENGMVASAHPDASAAGVKILKKGGNAVDAAVATFFALAVVHPFAGNLGGGGFALVKSGKEHYAIDFREKAPLKAHRDMYLDQDGNVIQGLSLLGHLASGVPGSVDGMVELHHKLGNLSWEDCLEPAIRLAEQGVVLTEREASGMNRYKKTFLEVNGEDLKYYTKAEGEWQTGELFIQKDLGKVLRQIQEKKRAGFYEGPVADMLVNEMQKGGGVISHEDLKTYSSAWRKPLYSTYRGHTIIGMPPSSSGGVALAQLLTMVEPFPLGSWGWNSDSSTHVIIEAERRVYADRAKWLGDTDFVNVPLDRLTDRDYLKQRWSSFTWDRANLSSEIEGGTIPGYESMETTHFSVVDKKGMAVSLTTTLNGAYGSKVIVDGAGFLMNNEMDDFSIKAGVPNMFGLIGNKANEIQPGKRMLSSMTPTIVEKNGDFLMAVGTPGGSTIITSVFQTILNVIDYKMSMQQAVNALKFHHQWLPDKIFYEPKAFTTETLEYLYNKGFQMQQQNGTLGRMDCILKYPDGRLEGASDPRSENTSVGF